MAKDSFEDFVKMAEGLSSDDVYEEQYDNERRRCAAVELAIKNCSGLVVRDIVANASVIEEYLRTGIVPTKQ
jgi:hypothetical protein